MSGVDDYLARFDGEVLDRLQTMRATIAQQAPEAVESMAYGLIGYKLAGSPLVYTGGFAGHVGFYATPNGHQAFAEELNAYPHGKGSVQFPHDRPLPLDLVRRVVAFRCDQVRAGLR